MGKPAKSAVERWQHSIEDAGPSAERLIRELADDIRSLRREVMSLADRAGSDGGHLLHDLGDEASEIARFVRKRGRRALRDLGHHAQGAGKSVRDNPFPVIAAVAALGFIVAWLARRD